MSGRSPDDHDEALAVVRVLYTLSVDRDRVDGEGDGVELERAGVGVDAAEHQRSRAADALLGEVEREVERKVLDRERTVALEVTRARCERERTAGSAAFEGVLALDAMGGSATIGAGTIPSAAGTATTGSDAAGTETGSAAGTEGAFTAAAAVRVLGAAGFA
ncbi:hypothetical protein [Salmonella enterica]|uniref:hypothetical protein n=1 Tax=Salmonella enterica TaxID=28901 RepID=UPI001CA4C6FE|nr:hypothetical protein [Salmonella enterica]